LGRAARQQAINDGAGGDPMRIGDHRRDANTGIAQDFDQAVFLHGPQGGDFVVITAHLAQGAQWFQRDETAAQQAGPCQHGQPLSVAGVGFATRHLFDLLGIHHLGLNPDFFQGRIRAFPVDVTSRARD